MVPQACSWPGAAALLFATAISLPAQTVTTLASFNGANGGSPYGALVQATDGNFYGTTAGGGAELQGNVFKLTPDGTITSLYSFCPQDNCSGGSVPFAGLIQASDGNFYGTTREGGANNYGTIFKITPAGTLTTLHSFCSEADCSDGAEPTTGLIQASDGNLYGTAGLTIFKITRGGVLTPLYTFCSQGPNCTNNAPPSGLIQASDGNFYGTTSYGPEANFGTVFKITPTGALTTLHTFCSVGPGCADGKTPVAGLIQAADGNLYGTTSAGEYPSTSPSDATNGGTIFKIALGGTLTTLHGFSLYGQPEATLIQATDGNLYGTTLYGGIYSQGTVFELTLDSSTASPTINPSGGVVSGASFQAGITPGSWITIYGTSLSSNTDTWANAIVNGNLPTSLDGVRVSVGGEPAYIAFISPTQINAVAPNFAPGMVEVTVTNASGTSPVITATARTTQPAFFQWGNYAVATTQDYSLVVKNGTLAGVATTPAKPGEVIILWGTGFGPTSPSAPAGVEVPSNTTYNTATTVTVTVGGKAATVYGAALAPGFAGLYQVAIQVPASLANGDYPVIATVSGAQSPAGTLITVQE